MPRLRSYCHVGLKMVKEDQYFRKRNRKTSPNTLRSHIYFKKDRRNRASTFYRIYECFARGIRKNV